MLQISGRVISVLVGLLGFVGTGLACDQHKNSSAAAMSQSTDPHQTAVTIETKARPQPVDVKKLSSVSTPLGESSKENTNEASFSMPVANNNIQVLEFVLAN